MESDEGSVRSATTWTSFTTSPLPTSRCRFHDVLIEGEGDKHNDEEEVDNCTYGSHGLWDLLLMHFAHILPLKPAFMKVGPSHRIME